MRLSYQKELNSLRDDAVTIDLHSLPLYSIQFVFKNLGVFRKKFILLTLNSVVASLLSFSSLLLLSTIISEVNTLSLETIYYFYCPLLIATYLARECCHYLVRRYAEAFSENFSDYIQQTLYKTLFKNVDPTFLSFSKERLQSIIGQYSSGSQSFLSGWFWGVAPMLTETILGFGVLYYQNKWTLLVNLCFIGVFLRVALGISRRFAPYARALSEQRIELGSSMQSLLQQSNTLVRFKSQDFFSWLLWPLTEKCWTALERLRIFHARRWFVQLSLLNAAYLGTLFLAIYQVKLGILGVGFLALLRYSYDRLWQTVIFVVEYVVQLTQEKQNTLILRKELLELVQPNPKLPSPVPSPAPFISFSLKDIIVEAHDTHQKRSFSFSIPKFTIVRGEHIAIRGHSGSGKTTFYMTLLGLTKITAGTKNLNGQSVPQLELPIAYISPEEPFFVASLRDNLILGQTIPDDEIYEILRLVKADEFIKDLGTVYGKPGVKFSYGQEQRLRLARGLLMRREIYIFDEAYSGLDSITRSIVRTNILGYIAGKTLIESSHDPKDLVGASRTFHIENGQLAETTA